MHPHRDKIEAQVERILESSEFSRAGKMALFLKYLVAQELKQQSTLLRERFIGIEVFDRPEDWDPKVDNVVRSEARRLRARLDSYYERVGSRDSVRIEIPKGGYRPRFEVAPESSAEEFTSTSSAGHRRRLWEAAGFFAILVVIVTAVSLGRGAFFNRAVVYHTAPFADEFGPEFSPTIAPDGKRLAYVWDGNNGSLHIWMKDLNGGAPKRLTDDDFAELDPAWSPDGRAIAFLRLQGSRCQVILRDLASRSSKVVGEIIANRGIWASSPGPLTGEQGPAWFPDQRSIVVSDSYGSNGAIALFRLALPGASRLQLTRPESGAEDLYPAVSPNGKYIAFARYTTHGVSDLFVMAVDGATIERLTTDGRSIRGIAWQPDNRHIVTAANRTGGFGLWSVDRKSKQIVSLPIATDSAADPFVDRSGAFLAFVEMRENWNIWRANLQDSSLRAPERLISSSGRNHSSVYSPDGRSIAFVSDRSGNWEIWLCNSNGTEERQLTHFNGPWIGGLTWSPDGKQIAFDARPNLHSQIYLISVENGTLHANAQNNHEERMPLWSRDGQSIFYNSDQTGTVALWRWDLNTGQRRELASSGFLIRQLTDGSLVYYDAQAGTFKRQTADNGDPSVIASGITPASVLSWTVYNDDIYFVVRENSTFSLRIFDIRSQHARKIGDLRFPIVTNTPSLSISPDGKWLLFEQQENGSSDIYIAREERTSTHR